MIAGVEFVTDRASKEPNPPAAAKIVYRAWELGLIIYYAGMWGNALEITPPLILHAIRAGEGVAILDQAIADVLDGKVSDEAVAPLPAGDGAEHGRTRLSITWSAISTTISRIFDFSRGSTPARTTRPGSTRFKLGLRSSSRRGFRRRAQPAGTVGRRPDRPETRTRASARVLLIGHADTVYPEGTAAARPLTFVGDRLLGPAPAI